MSQRQRKLSAVAVLVIAGLVIAGGIGGVARADDASTTLTCPPVQTGQELHCFEGHGGRVRCVVFASSGRALSGSFDQTLQLWSLPR